MLFRSPHPTYTPIGPGPGPYWSIGGVGILEYRGGGWGIGGWGVKGGFFRNEIGGWGVKGVVKGGFIQFIN